MPLHSPSCRPVSPMEIDFSARLICGKKMVVILDYKKIFFPPHVEHLRTPEERRREDELLQLLVEIVQERDKLVEERNSPEL